MLVNVQAPMYSPEFPVEISRVVLILTKEEHNRLAVLARASSMTLEDYIRCVLKR